MKGVVYPAGGMMGWGQIMPVMTKAEAVEFFGLLVGEASR